jgi:glutathione synthase/RimK-type ligase-like ATP-grasp enzyme
VLGQLHYESADWRKNVGATITVADVDPELLARARRTADRLGLAIAGVDYVVTESEAMLLEVNAYPGLEDLPDASEAFIGMPETWWSAIVKANQVGA